MTALGTGSPGCAFYTVANAHHLIGALALLSSARLAGHAEPFRLVHAGLTDAQRRPVADQVDLVSPPPDHEMDIRPHAPAPHPPSAGTRQSASRSAGHPLREYADGLAPFFLHHTMAKHWLQETPTNVYSTRLPSLHLSEDVAVRLEPRDVPLRLRPGHLGELDNRRVHAQSVVRRGLRRRFDVLGIRPRREDRRRAAPK